ncbi:MAG UNVERIFIED_CONTAM: hypothetical protein LVT10_13195 [Anaerolineae bacterium]
MGEAGGGATPNRAAWGMFGASSNRLNQHRDLFVHGATGICRPASSPLGGGGGFAHHDPPLKLAHQCRKRPPVAHGTLPEPDELLPTRGHSRPALGHHPHWL